MGLFLGLVCVFALFAPLYLGAPMQQVEQKIATLHQREKRKDDMELAAVSFFFLIFFNNTLFNCLQLNY